LGDTGSEIRTRFRAPADSTYKVSFTENYSGSNSSQSDPFTILKVAIEGYEKIEIDYFFSNPDNKCDSIVVRYFCSTCVDRHIKDFLSDKGKRWRVLGVDRYISGRRSIELSSTIAGKKIRKVGSPQMKIIRTPENPVCATVYFSVPMMDRDEWKELTKK
jgi:hypothetical protein